MGFGVIICGAGMAAHLAGAVAARTTLPVIGVPTVGERALGRGCSLRHRADAEGLPGGDGGHRRGGQRGPAGGGNPRPSGPGRAERCGLSRAAEHSPLAVSAPLALLAPWPLSSAASGHSPARRHECWACAATGPLLLGLCRAPATGFVPTETDGAAPGRTSNDSAYARPFRGLGPAQTDQRPDTQRPNRPGARRRQGPGCPSARSWSAVGLAAGGSWAACPPELTEPGTPPRGGF